MRQSTVKACLAGLFIALMWCGIPAGPVWSQNAEGIQEETLGQASSSGGAPAGEVQEGRGAITDIRTDMQGEEVTIEVEASSNLQYTAFKLMEPLRLVLDFQDMDSTDKEQMEVNLGVVQTIRPMYFEDAGVQRLEIDLASTAVYEIQKPEDNRLLITLKGSPMQTAPVKEKPSPVEPAPTVAAAPPMAPQMLSSQSADTCRDLFNSVSSVIQVEFRDAELRNVFRFLAEFANINIVVAPGITGGATLKVDSVPWNKVMELVMANYKLGRKCEGGIVRVGIAEDLIAERFNQPIITQMVRLNYGDPDEVIKNLDKMKSTFGKVVADKRTNSIIVTDTESAVMDMMEVVLNLDQPTHQVQIESKIIQINRDFLQELGIQWGFDGVTFRNPQFPNAIAFGGAARSDGALSAPLNAGGVDFGTDGNRIPGNQLAAPRISPGFIVDLATVGTPFGAVATSLSAIGGDLTLDLQLSALERQGKSKTVASPKVTTLNNKEAKIRSGTRLPFQTTDPAEGTKIEFIDAVIELKVTPQITSEDMIYLAVAAQQNSPDAVRNVGGVPVILTREAFTELLVANKDTAVIGGLFQKRISDTTRAIPYLSEIPVVGQIFKSNAETDNVSELLILIKPTIVKGLDS